MFFFIIIIILILYIFVYLLIYDCRHGRRPCACSDHSVLSACRVCADRSESSLIASWSPLGALAVYERGGVFRSDNVDA